MYSFEISYDTFTFNVPFYNREYKYFIPCSEYLQRMLHKNEYHIDETFTKNNYAGKIKLKCSEKKSNDVSALIEKYFELKKSIPCVFNISYTSFDKKELEKTISLINEIFKTLRIMPDNDYVINTSNVIIDVYGNVTQYCNIINKSNEPLYITVDLHNTIQNTISFTRNNAGYKLFLWHIYEIYYFLSSWSGELRNNIIKPDNEIISLSPKDLDIKFGNGILYAKNLDNKLMHKIRSLTKNVYQNKQLFIYDSTPMSHKCLDMWNCDHFKFNKYLIVDSSLVKYPYIYLEEYVIPNVTINKVVINNCNTKWDYNEKNVISVITKYAMIKSIRNMIVRNNYPCWYFKDFVVKNNKIKCVFYSDIERQLFLSETKINIGIEIVKGTTEDACLLNYHFGFPVFIENEIIYILFIDNEDENISDKIYEFMSSDDFSHEKNKMIEELIRYYDVNNENVIFTIVNSPIGNTNMVVFVDNGRKYMIKREEFFSLRENPATGNCISAHAKILQQLIHENYFYGIDAYSSNKGLLDIEPPKLLFDDFKFSILIEPPENYISTINMKACKFLCAHVGPNWYSIPLLFSDNRDTVYWLLQSFVQGSIFTRVFLEALILKKDISTTLPFEWIGMDSMLKVEYWINRLKSRCIDNEKYCKVYVDEIMEKLK